MRTLASVVCVFLIAACGRQNDSSDWKLLEKKDGLVVSVQPNSIRRVDGQFEGWVKAEYSKVQSGSVDSDMAQYDHEIDRWRIDCNRAEYAVVKRVFFLKDKQVAEWPKDRRDDFGTASGMATPGSRSDLIVNAFCN